jgi:hypothetical protein
MNIIIYLIIIILLLILFKNDLYDVGVSYFMKIKLLLDYKDQKYLINNFFKINPNIENINYKNFENSKNINASNKSINQYKIINMIDYKENINNVINHKDVNNNLYKILISCLNHVNLDGQKINVNDCIICDLLYSNVQSFPFFYTDVEWGIFNKSNGFQVWYLLENNDSVGNMFLLETPEVLSSSYLAFNENNIKIIEQCSKKYIKDIQNYNNSKMKYLNMKEGECLIFGQNTYHMSDFRKSKNRYAVNFRIIIKDSDGGIPININKKCLYSKNFLNKIKIKNIKFENNKIYPNMFDLMYII